MVDISIVNGIINQLITWGAPPCIYYASSCAVKKTDLTPSDQGTSDDVLMVYPGMHPTMLSGFGQQSLS